MTFSIGSLICTRMAVCFMYFSCGVLDHVMTIREVLHSFTAVCYFFLLHIVVKMNTCWCPVAVVDCSLRVYSFSVHLTELKCRLCVWADFVTMARCVWDNPLNSLLFTSFFWLLWVQEMKSFKGRSFEEYKHKSEGLANQRSFRFLKRSSFSCCVCVCVFLTHM